MITVIHEHSVDLDLLRKPEMVWIEDDEIDWSNPKSYKYKSVANILDLGCRGFLFTDHMERLGHKVYPVDIDKLDTDKPYYQIAISNYDGKCGVHHEKDKQATRIKEGSEISCYTLESFSLACGVEDWDLIKMDIEGEEYKVIMSLKKAPARQISFECHCHTGIYGFKEVDEMIEKLKTLGYEFVQHELSEQHGCSSNFWDSLAILK